MERDKVAAEIILRESIRKIISALEKKRKNELLAEKKLRKVIRSIMAFRMCASYDSRCS